MTKRPDILVELADGTLVRKAEDDLKPEDMVVFDGPEHAAGAAAEQAAFEAEIAAAGGLQAWKLRQPQTV